MQRGLDEARTAYDAARDMLLASACAFTGETTPRGCLLASSTASVSKDAIDVQEAVAEVRRDILARLALRINRDIKSGRLPEAIDAHALAALVISVIQGMSVLARDGLGREALEAMVYTALAAWPTSPLGDT
ncbi:tetR family transcriptional regulator [Asticcacaulis biprosthecium C19]|uniref:TetR family transcriptional regulator n=1 Tax=Asticcacaulis biprosthecium C19 TaxID=715226 RepID=F4QI58_9CAUL|nr:tetR family transcriptional regulator [Asticcacaulis biprosthecium C19]